MSRETVETAKALETYKYGFETAIESEKAPKGLTEETIRFISAKKEEPEWLLGWRLEAFSRWLKMDEPTWAMVKYPAIDYQDAYYYSAPKTGAKYKSIDDVPKEILDDFEKLGIPLKEAEVLLGVEGAPKVAVDAVFDSVSVATTFRKELEKAGVIFMSISEAVAEHPELVRKYLGSVVPVSDNFFATLNAAVFSDGTFVYVPEGVKCPMELSTYFRINEANTGQFERTLIIAAPGSYVSYLEGCTAPMRDENQLHAAVVELVAEDDAEIKYSTVQNWYPGDADGKGGIYNFVTKRADCRGANSKVSWTQVETGSAITWKYPSCVLKGDNSQGEFYSIAITNNHQQADTGTKMIHLGRNTRSRIIAKGVSAGKSNSTYRGLVSVHRKAAGARNFTQCDSLLIGAECGAHTIPYIESKNPGAVLEHEATTSRLSEDQLFYCRQRGLSEEDAVALLVNGFCKEVLQELPMEFAVEAQKLVSVSLEGSVG
ncbi:MAG: Fe-S cluster assembly protein SufB [Parvularculaceae bacterium]